MTSNFKGFEYATNDLDGWPEPLAFRETVGPPFPLDAMPPRLSEMVHAHSIALQVPPGATGTLALGFLAIASAGRCKVVLRPDWFEPVNLYVLVSLPSGERKSPVFRRLARPISQRERVLAHRARAQAATARARVQMLEEKHKTAVKAAAAATTTTDQEAAEEQAESLAQEVEDFEIPKPPRLLAEDATPEAVARLLSEQGGRIAIASDEGGLFETIAGRYSNGVPNLDVFLKGYSGDDLRVDRQNHAPVFVEHATLSMVLTVQPDVLREVVSQKGFRGHGFLSRWLFELPASAVGWRSDDPPPVPESLDALWDNTVGRLLDLPSDKPIDLCLGSEAQAAFSRFRQSVEERMRPGGDFHGMHDWANKLPGQVARIAGVLHMWNWAVGDGEGHPAASIDAGTLSSAIALGEHYAEHASIALGLGTLDADTPRAEEVWSYIRSRGLGSFDFHGLHQNLRRRFSHAELERLLRLIEDLGYIKKLDSPSRPSPGRPPSPKYEVNPRTFATRTQKPRNDAMGGVYEEKIE